VKYQCRSGFWRIRRIRRIGLDYSARALSLQWHFLSQSWFRPYIGGGAAYTFFGSKGNIKADDEFSWRAGAGFDVGQRSLPVTGHGCLRMLKVRRTGAGKLWFNWTAQSKWNHSLYMSGEPCP
jgi:hypothetical protein